MRFPRLIAVIVAVIGIAIPTVLADTQPKQVDPLSIQSLLVVGKGSGACGILHLQLQFQGNTKLEGGDEFIVRFWTTEAARLGKTLEEYAAFCVTTVSAYDKLEILAEQVN
jgi:hypothetical protein